MENVAAIDAGSNTIRMLVVERKGRALRPLSRMRVITSMGRALRREGRIGEPEFGRSVEALRSFRVEMDRLGVTRYRACGTAALRDAANRDLFLDAAAQAGVRLEVVSAEEEAALAWAGMRMRLPRLASCILMDIGGGSTEFTVGPGKGESVSLPIGVVSLCGAFEISDPPAQWQLRALHYYIAERVASGTSALGEKRYRRLVGTAGTFTTLAALDMRLADYRPERIDGYTMDIERVRRWEKRLAGMTDAERLALPGMEKGRERYMLPGAVQAVIAMERFGARELVVSDAGLLEGIIEGIAFPRERGEEA